jgi:U2-associated protein SR140
MSERDDPKTLLPWGIQQVQPGSMKTISETKLATFAVGIQKKSRFQKAREEAEEKKRQEEEEAKKIYGQFVASFAVNDEDGCKTFVR